MLPLGPILAEIATLSVADRTEARYIISNDTHYEAATRPQAGLGVQWRHFNLSLGYGPSITVIPLETEPRDVIVFHNAFVSGTYSWQRTQLTISEFGGYGSQNFRALALTGGQVGAPTAQPGTPPTGTANSPAPAPTTPPMGLPSTGTGNVPAGDGSNQAGNQIRASNNIVRFVNLTTSAALTNQYSNQMTLRGELSYTITGSVREEDRLSYPLVKGPRLLGSLRYRLGRVDDFTTAVSAQYASSSVGNSVWIGTTTGTWGHKLDPNTLTMLGAGVSGSRTPLTFGFVSYTIYPVITGSISHVTRLARGTLGVAFGASATPVVDLVSAAADPRLGFNGLIGWKRDRFNTSITASTAVSLQSSNEAGSLTAAGAGGNVGYQLGKAVSVDSGIRIAYQAYQGTTAIPLSYAVFAGFTFGLQQVL